MLRVYGHPVATCCDLLRHVGGCSLKFETGQIVHAPFVDIGQDRATLLRPGMRIEAQHVATRRNSVAKRVEHVSCAQ